MADTMVSVVTTVYNGEEYFDRAIPGILVQSRADFEWLIVDDGSTDATLERLQAVAADDPRVRILSPGRLGRIAALNFAIEKAEGNYIVQQDFDDVSYPERIQRQIGFLDAHPEVGVVGGQYVLIDENRGERYLRKPPEAHADIVRALSRYIPIANTLATFRKKAWEDAGGYPDNVQGIEDIHFWISMLGCGWQAANIPEVLGEHWVYADSFWHRATTYRTRQRALARAHLRAVKELGLPLWMRGYPLGRYVYAFLPVWLKRMVRRTVGGSREEDTPQ